MCALFSRTEDDYFLGKSSHVKQANTYMQLYKYIMFDVFPCTCNACVQCGQTRCTHCIYACRMPALKMPTFSASPGMSTRPTHICKVHKYMDIYVFLCTCNVCIHCGQTRRTHCIYACHMPILKETASSAGPRMSSRRIQMYISIQIHKYVCISMYV